MNSSFRSGDLTLRSHLTRPSGRGGRMPGVIVCHGFPVYPLDARRSAGTFPELVDRIASEVGAVTMTFTFRGCGASEGNFGLQGWMDDMRAAVEHLVTEADPEGIWLVGTHTGGSLALCAAASDPRITGVALLGARADFDDWADHPRKFLEHARDIGAIRSPRFPEHFDEWSREFRRFRPVEAARRLGASGRSALVLHGDDDDTVPTSDARQVATAHGAADLRILGGAGHRLRHDPRAVAILIGWLERQKNLRTEPAS